MPQFVTACVLRASPSSILRFEAVIPPSEAERRLTILRERSAAARAAFWFSARITCDCFSISAIATDRQNAAS